MDLGIKGKGALVLASSKGLGLAVARGLAAEGVAVHLCARDRTRLRDACNAIAQDFNVHASYTAIDLTKPEAPQAVAQEARDSLGVNVSILINNCGGPPPRLTAETTPEQWDEGFRRIFLASVAVTHRVLEPMRRQRFGRVITITSLAAIEPIPLLGVSAAMRAALSAFTKSLATEVAADGVTAHTVMPGVIHTDRIVELRRAKVGEEGLDAEMARTAAAIPARRLGSPAELADLVVFLASTRASYLNGCNIAVDGGLRQGWA